jgi:hypothetical protein
MNYVSIDLAKLLKENGFDEYVPTWYSHVDGNIYSNTTYYSCEIPRYNKEVDTRAPLQDVVRDWIRGKYHIEINIRHFYKGNPEDGILEYNFSIDRYYPVPAKRKDDNINYQTYREALDAAMIEALTNFV